MKRRHTLNDFGSVDYNELSRKTAFHEAGHAAAIYFGNRQKLLPPVFFQIIVSHCSCNPDQHSCLTHIEGGRLIHTLPSSFTEIVHDFSPLQQQAYQQAFEADIINLLVGSLAEANYIAQRDNEIINPHLIPLSVLHNYGGSSDLEIINEYLQCLVADKTQQEKKIIDLFFSAFDFINDWAHWYSINALAEHILNSDHEVMDYEEITTVLESGFLSARKCPWYTQPGRLI